MGNSTVWSARNGLRASIVWSHIAEEARIREGSNFGKDALDKLTVRRVKALKDEPYTQKEAEAAIGLRTDNGPRQAAKENTMDVEVEMENSGLMEEELAT